MIHMKDFDDGTYCILDGKTHTVVCRYNGGNFVKYNRLALDEKLKGYVLYSLISKSGLDETYQAWLRERKKQEAVTVL